MASGRPDWYGSMTMHGKYGDAYKPINVDEEGNLLALMTGLLEGVYTPIAVDDEGIMRANLVLQDLPAMTVRPYYTEALIYRIIVNADALDIKQLVRKTGKGIVLAGGIRASDPGLVENDMPMLAIDDVILQNHTFKFLHDEKCWHPGDTLMHLTGYDVQGNRHCKIALQPGITFETSISLLYEEVNDNTPSIYVELAYALVP